ncbi:MAG: hypothetical protein ACON4Z_09390 [Planctomycetota bacterium]
MSRAAGRIAAGVALSLLGACAWSNPDNRPVWTAFEQRVVPEPGPWFYVGLPVTAPLGVGAILADTLVAHPLQVLDDAARDAAELWDPARLDFEQAYYTQLAGLPVRAAFTPVAFGGSWLGRCVFDLPPHEPDLSEEEQRALQERERLDVAAQQQAARVAAVEAMRAWLERGSARSAEAPGLEAWDAQLDGALARALGADAAGRRTLHEGMLRAGVVRLGPYDAALSLSDPDPVVRFAALSAWPEAAEVPASAQRALLEDPVESVRLLALRRFGR